MKTPAHVEIDLVEDEDVVRVGSAAIAVDEDSSIGAVLADDDVVDEDLDPADRLPKKARKNADGSVTLALLYPRKVISKKDGKVREREFAEIVMHRLTGADQRVIAGVSDDLTAVIAFARSTRLPQAVMNVLFDKLDAADINAMGQVLNHFFGSGPKTGR
jgi:hypothetical protein